MDHGAYPGGERGEAAAQAALQQAAEKTALQQAAPREAAAPAAHLADFTSQAARRECAPLREFTPLVKDRYSWLWRIWRSI